MQKPRNIDRKNRFLPKGIYLWHPLSRKYAFKNWNYQNYRAAIKVNGKVKTIGYYDCLFKACQAFSIAHEEFYGKKPHWYKEFKQFYKKETQPLEF